MILALSFDSTFIRCHYQLLSINTFEMLKCRNFWTTVVAFCWVWIRQAAPSINISSGSSSPSFSLRARHLSAAVSSRLSSKQSSKFLTFSKLVRSSSSKQNLEAVGRKFSVHNLRSSKLSCVWALIHIRATDGLRSIWCNYLQETGETIVCRLLRRTEVLYKAVVQRWYVLLLQEDVSRERQEECEKLHDSDWLSSKSWGFCLYGRPVVYLEYHGKQYC